MHLISIIAPWLRRARPLLAVPFVVLFALSVAGPASGGGNGARPWPDGRVSYFDASGSRVAVNAAARRWNESGARVSLVPAFRRRGDLTGALRAAELRLALPADASEQARLDAELAALRALLN